MNKLFSIIKKLGLKAQLNESINSLEVNVFLREKIIIQKTNGIFKIQNGVTRHVFLSIILLCLSIVMKDNNFVNAFIASLSLYNVIVALIKDRMSSSIMKIIYDIEIKDRE